MIFIKSKPEKIFLSEIYKLINCGKIKFNKVHIVKLPKKELKCLKLRIKDIVIFSFLRI